MHFPVNEKPEPYQELHVPVKSPIQPHFAPNSVPQGMVLVDPSSHNINSNQTRQILLDKGPTPHILENHKLLDIAMFLLEKRQKIE